MEELVTLVANLGFPIAVSIYLLVRIEGKMDELTGSVKELSRVIAKLL
ncbi:MAG: YvrJ family protein [Candidatus Syntrophonatronum acetioxidans]|uniref:YvrJ family protein n=1 Tax=Candidatus Syntrophonatronum acetioxidans TaxID=1795816 RepID=A0A424Y9M7_9FIRM|nr:MAG: YvrJ family protein [Candidatus Syntrophonatronum acetioxidans]RQD73135.1 MAG: YvrJ family protein [Candidatus Syntrophonatronum acetioxidans]